MSTSMYGAFFLCLLLTRKSLVLATTTATCPDNNCCTVLQNLLLDITAAISTTNSKLSKQAKDMEEMMTVILAMNSTLNKQAKDLEDMKTNMDKVVDATSLTSTQLNLHLNDQLVHDDRLIMHAELSENQLMERNNMTLAERKPRDCSDIRKMNFTTSGVYRVYPGIDDRRIEMDVYCDLNSSRQSWLVFQRRMDGSENFDRVYSDYERGFGNLTGEFWLGNEKLSLLTMNRRYKLRVDLADFDGEKRHAEYSTFYVAPATDNYRLTVGGYSGDAGDSMDTQNGMQFTTGDVDNDAWTGGNCALRYGGAWWYPWYNACYGSNLNGRYLRGSHTTSLAEGIEWGAWHGDYYSLKATEMKIAAY